jgi:hypothetical protein
LLEYANPPFRLRDTRLRSESDGAVRRPTN